MGIISEHNFFEKIVSLENLFLAWEEFKKGKMYKTDVQNYNFFLENNIFVLHRELKAKRYQHSPYHSFYIKDPKLRHIHKACVRDRVLHHAIFRILYPIFDKFFIFDSYSCRISKGTHKAVDRLQTFCRKESKNNSRTVYILKLDIKKFFDSVDHNILLSLIKKRIEDKDLFWLLEVIISSFEKGIPLGNITSQLFANICLNELDYFIKQILKIKYYIRYCDDFIMIRKDKNYLQNLIPKIACFLKQKLKLSLHPDKISLRKYNQGIDFLGYVSFPHYRILRTRTKNRMFNKINSENLQSYLGILKHCNGYKLREEIYKIIFNIK